VRHVRGWLLPIAIAVPAVIASAWLREVFGIPAHLWALGWVALMGVATIVIWILSGGTIAQILTWALPTLVVAVAWSIWLTIPIGLLLAACLLLPLAGGVIPPVGRLHGWYTEHATRWLVRRFLPAPDRHTEALLLDAKRGGPFLQAELRRIEEPARVIDALRTLEEGIRSVPAPDTGWAAAIRQTADAVGTYREMLDRLRPYDDRAAGHAIRQARRAVHDHLRSRSLGYRVLTHQFVAQGEADPQDRAMGSAD
jgi:hypothetical protein